MAVTNMQKIGNSFGVIIGKKLLAQAGLEGATQVKIEAQAGSIVIKPLDPRKVINRDLRTWGKQFKTAIEKGQKPEKSVWNGAASKNADKDWVW